jgi:chemotaxis protein methyltransferase CheR
MQIPFSIEHFDYVKHLAQSEFGICIGQEKKQLVYSRLLKRIENLGLTSFEQYIDILERNEHDEVSSVLSALTTNVTKFFREQHHFDYMKSEMFPNLLEKCRNGERVRLWSAGCSTGQEAYSIAMHVMSHCPELAQGDFKILATDIDSVVVEKARRGVYLKDELSNVPKHSQSYFFEGDLGFRVHEDLKSLTDFAVLNLMDDFPFKGDFDVIFCRNVTIYFDQESQDFVWSKLSRSLSSDGALFVGHSERVESPDRYYLNNVGLTTYRKTQL